MDCPNIADLPYPVVETDLEEVQLRDAVPGKYYLEKMYNIPGYHGATIWQLIKFKSFNKPWIMYEMIYKLSSNNNRWEQAWGGQDCDGTKAMAPFNVPGLESIKLYTFLTRQEKLERGKAALGPFAKRNMLGPASKLALGFAGLVPKGGRRKKTNRHRKLRRTKRRT